jgi:hypothetical protein
MKLFISILFSIFLLAHPATQALKDKEAFVFMEKLLLSFSIHKIEPHRYLHFFDHLLNIHMHPATNVPFLKDMSLKEFKQYLINGKPADNNFEIIKNYIESCI